MSRAVAISTTGDEHRIGFLETSVKMWDSALSPGDSLFVTVDGTEEEAAFVAECVSHLTGSVFRVGQRPGYVFPPTETSHRMGVAVNKNTGLDLLMGSTDAEHLFLCDDDTFPWSHHALSKHTSLAETLPHSMVCWGAHRLNGRGNGIATWLWPRGVMLYQTRAVVEQVGGMVEEFGIGGHEHAEWSRRIHQHGLTPAPYCSPVHYGMPSALGDASRASVLWHCEDMRKPYETRVELGHRRKAITSVRRIEGWEKAEKIMERMDGNTAFVPYRAHENGRASATLCLTSTGQGAGGEL